MALSAQQKRFAELFAGGMPAGRAYEKAGYASKGDVADVCASQLLRRPKVAAFLEELRAESRSNAVMTATEVKEGLSRLMKRAEGEGDHTGFTALANRLAKMEGFDEPDKLQVTYDVDIDFENG